MPDDETSASTSASTSAETTGGGEKSTKPGASPEQDWQQRRRLAAIFGDVLPDTTSDERDGAPSASAGDSASDAWLKAQVPPHHGG